MFNMISNKKGLSLVEVMIAVMLTFIGIMALMSLFPQGYILGTRSDQLGRAAAILREELETQELRIMNPCTTPIPIGTTTKSVRTSGHASSEPGDATFTVQTTISSAGANIWRVNIRVTGTDNKPSITESLIVTRQEYFRHGC